MNDIETATKILDLFDKGREALTKHAFTPTGPPAGPATAMPAGPPPGAPMGPAMAGGAPPPPMDPNAMPPGAPMPPPPGDPNAMPPMDPAMAGGPPPPPGPEAGGPPPPAQGGIPPQLESQLAQMAQGVGGVVEAVESQQANMDQMSDRMLELENKISDLSEEKAVAQAKEELKAPAGFEGHDALAALQQAPELASGPAAAAPKKEAAPLA